jgi:hypothetical protein
VDVDRDAPAYAEGRIEIAAPRRTVWDVLVGFADWPEWNTGVASVEYAGPLEPGALFRWKSGPGTIRSRVEEVDVPRAIAWTGRTFGIKAAHAWQLEESGGKTVVTTQEAWRGVVVRVLRRTIAPTLQRSIDDGLVALEAEAERRAASPP